MIFASHLAFDCDVRRLPSRMRIDAAKKYEHTHASIGFAKIVTKTRFTDKFTANERIKIKMRNGEEPACIAVGSWKAEHSVFVASCVHFIFHFFDRVSHHFSRSNLNWKNKTYQHAVSKIDARPPHWLIEVSLLPIPTIEQRSFIQLLYALESIDLLRFFSATLAQNDK